MTAKSSHAPKASIVIRSFNEEKHLGALLERIREQSFKDFEIILVDSGSTDSTLEIAKRYALRIETIDAKDFTFGRSLNQGIAVARGAIAVIASAHILPRSKTWLEDLLMPFGDPEVAISYGKQRGGKGSRFSEDQHWRHWYPDESDFDQAQAFCNNANSAIRRAYWEMQDFDEQLTGLEDIAWAAWAKQQGYKITYVAEAEVEHLHDENPAQIINRHRREAIALKQLLPHSRFSLWHLINFFVRKSLADMRQAIHQGVLLKQIFGILAFRLQQYWGTYRGYQQQEPLNAQSIQSFYFPPSALEPKAWDDKTVNGPDAVRESR